MLNNFISLIVSYFFTSISIIGYGFLFSKFFFKNEKLNFGYYGLYGIYFLIIYSYISNYFIAHGYVHNLYILCFGFLYFNFYIISKLKEFKKDIILYLIIFSVLFLGILIEKNHDDFSYYHFPYTYYLTQSESYIGIGKFGHGLRTPSSIFYLNSLFATPLIEYFSFNFGQIFIMAFVNIILVKKINKYMNSYKVNSKYFDQTFYLVLFSFIFINIFFYRISEHGTDRSAMIIILLFIVELFELYKKKIIKNKDLSNLFLLSILAISLKAFYITYLLFIIPILFVLNEKNKNFNFNIRLILFNRNFICFLVLLSLVLLSYFLNTGCLIYPVSVTCFENLSWSFPKISVQKMNDWYELWSKAGATPTFRTEEPAIYISKFNWVSGWIERYFFNKVTDFILGIMFLSLVICYVYKKNISLNFLFLNNKLKNIIYLTIIILFLEWFYNHPALRYGGFSLIALLIFLPLTNFFNKLSIGKETFRNLTVFLIILPLFVFLLRNIHRIDKEINTYDYKPFMETFYSTTEHNFRIQRDITDRIKVFKNCKDTKLNCEIKNNITIEFNKIIFVN
tara:strand:- start:2072 stop:3769 length:1698 start_codon:yes stop_codon:yes gene_type:complete